MSASPTASNQTAPAPGRLGVARSALTGAIVFAVLFALCWLTGLLTGFGGLHMGMAAYPMGHVAPFASLLLGLVCAAAAGLFVGGLTAFTYNALEPLAR